MFHFGMIDLRTDIFLVIISLLVLLLQLFICFKVRKKVIRLLQMIFFGSLTVIFTVLATVFDGWDRFGFLFLSLCAAFLLGASVVGYVIFHVFERVKRKRNDR